MVLRSLLILLLIISLTYSAFALDFYGVNVTDKDAPSSFMRYGINGYRPTVSGVDVGTPAAKYGFKEGDIILSINDKNIRRSFELNQFSTDILSVLVFSSPERKTLTINRLAIETEKSNRIEAERKAATERKRAYTDERQDNSPAVKYDDAALEKRYGKSTPEQRAREDQRAWAAITKDQKELDEQIRKRKETVRAEEAQKLSKTYCTGIPGECGSGRLCLVNNFTHGGTCMMAEEANRIAFESMRERRAQQRESDRDGVLNRKLDDIDRKLRGW